LLEDAAAHGETAQIQRRLDEAQGRLAEVLKQLTAACAETVARDARIAEILASASWRLTAPVRFVGRQFRKDGDGN
jgi:hypothetical protein